MKIIYMVLVLGLLSGCATTEHLSKILIPIPAKQPNMEVPSLPYLPIQSLDKESSKAKIARAYIASVKLLLNDNVNLREALEAYQD